MGEAAIDPEPANRWLTIVRSAGLGLALAGTIAIGWQHTHEPTAPAKTCAAHAAAHDDQVREPDSAKDCTEVDGHGGVTGSGPNGSHGTN